MKIYFDDNLIEETDESGIKSLSNNFELFDSSFYLGSTASNTFNLTIDKEIVISQPEVVTIYDETDLIATLVVDNIEEDDTTYTYTLTDKMLNLEFNYDASQIFNNGSATLLQIALDICSKAGIELATQNFRGYNKSISWYDNTRTARTYIGYIAELNGGYAQIGEDGRLYFKKQKQDSMDTINIEDCSDFKIGDKRKITKVQLEVSSTLTYVFGDNTGNTLTLNSDNVFITTESEVEGIYNDIKDFIFYNFETSNCPIDFSIKAGNIITFTDGESEYPTIAQYNLTYNNEWNGGYSFKIDSIKQENTQIQSTDTKIKNLQTIVDRDTNTITQAIGEIDSQNEKISQVKQTVDELNSKISDIADITVSKESTNAYVEFEDINQSEPIRVVVHPINEENNISYLYPRNNLYPSDNLFSKTRLLKFTNVETEEIFYYTIPDNLLYYASEDGESDVYDEFILDYEGQSCTVTKKVGYNADGTTYPLSSQVTTEYDYPQILLTDGNQYKVELVGYNSAYLFVRLMAQNIYTTQFATRSEVSSEINQTAQQIDLSVNKKLTNYVTETEMNSAITVKANSITSSVSNTYATKNELSTAKSEIKQTTDGITSTVSSKVGKNEVVSIINQSAEQITLNSNRLVVNSNNFKLSATGNITASSGDIGGWSISGSKLYATSNGKVSAIQAPSNSTNWVFASGGTSHDSYSGCPFRVNKNGTLYATDAHITGEITATSGKFKGTVSGSTITGSSITCGNNFSVTSSGDVTARSITITGGSASGTTITNPTLSNGTVTNTKYTFKGKTEAVLIDEKEDGMIEGYYIGDSSTLGYSTRRYAIAAFNSGGFFQTFNTSGTMKAYFDINGAHTSSDITLKENIKIIEQDTSIDFITSLNPIEYNYINENINNRHRGLSAQEVESVLNKNNIKNQIYEINNDGKYSLNYLEIIPDLINCIKNLNTRVEYLENKLKESDINE